MNSGEFNHSDQGSAEIADYVCVTCKYCKGREVPLQELHPDFCLQLPLPQRFTARHSACDLELAYDISDLYRGKLKSIASFAPHPAFPRLPRLQHKG
jgi:hypothetical protein